MATPQPQMQCGNSFQPQPMVTMTTLSQPEINSSLERKKVNQNRIGNLAIFEIVFGIVAIVMGVINITSVYGLYGSHASQYYIKPRILYGEGVWAGVVILITGILGIRTAKSNASKSMIKCYKVFSILGAIFAVASTILATIASVAIFNNYIFWTEPQLVKENGNQAIYIQQPGVVSQQPRVFLHQQVHQPGMEQQPTSSPNRVQELPLQQHSIPQIPTVVQYLVLPHQQITQQSTVPQQELVPQPVVFQQPAMFQQSGMLYPQLGHIMQAQQPIAPTVPLQMTASAPIQSASKLEQGEHEVCAYTNPDQSYE